MAISVLEITPSPEQSPSREHSPAEVEDACYQPIPPRPWHHLILDTLTPMTLRLRSQPHPQPTYISDKPRTSFAKAKPEYVVIETPLPLSESDTLHAKRPVPVLAIIRLACILIPVTILCLLLVDHF